MLRSLISKVLPGRSQPTVAGAMSMARNVLSDIAQGRQLTDVADAHAETARLRVLAADGAFPRERALTLGTVAIRDETGILLHPEQIAGASLIADGSVAELKTGEGKTFVAILAAYVESLAGSVHVVTVNDYLATRDAALASRVLGRLGVTVGVVTPSLSHAGRIEAYGRDVVYVTGAELGFDYLRDFTAPSLDLVVSPTRRSAIVDEVDSLLIDEARTPIIISEQTTLNAAKVAKVRDIVEALPKAAFDHDVRQNVWTPKDNTWADIEGALQSASLLAPDMDLQSDGARTISHRVTQAIQARFVLRRDKDYIVRAGRILIVDQNTGQISEGRSYSDGLHQAIEARENIQQTPESNTVASISYQNLFRSYDRLAGLTGTAASDAKEFDEVYGLKVHVVPTHAPVIRIDDRDEIYRSTREKLVAVVDEVTEAHFRLQPVLVGSRSIEKCEEVASALEAAGFLRIPANDPEEIARAIQGARDGKARRVFRVLDAKDPEFEAGIVAQAGLPGAITVATTIAGRGTDVKLGGDADFRLIGVDDPEARDAIQKETRALLLLARDRGGLYVIGTERMDSRRQDDQFRGRSGRQGDPGRSRFFLSIEDDILANHPGVARIVDMAKLGEGEALSAKIVDKSVENAQKVRENMHFEIRTSLLKMDVVMEEQRKLVAELRHEALTCKDFEVWYLQMVEDVITDIVDRHASEREVPDLWSFTAIEEEFARVARIHLPVRTVVEKRGLQDPQALAKALISFFGDVHGKVRSDAPQAFDVAVGRIILGQLDAMWRQHVEGLEYMRKGVFLRENSRDGGQVATYRADAAKSFETMILEWRRQVVQTVRSLRFQAPAAPVPPIVDAA